MIHDDDHEFKPSLVYMNIELSVSYLLGDVHVRGLTIFDNESCVSVTDEHVIHLKLNSGPPGIPVLKTQNSPRQGKNSRKFSFGKMLDFARSNTISTQTSNICLNHLQ